MSAATKIPFSVDRNQALPLSRQIANGLSRAIRHGHYEPGDRLPSISAIARQLAVSEMSVRTAVKALSDAGEVVARPRTGIRVSAADRVSWRAHVILVNMSDSYYFVRRNRQLHARCRDANVRLTQQLLLPEEGPGFADALLADLASQPVDLVVLDGEATRMIPALEASGHPYVCTGLRRPAPGARASVLDDKIAVDEQVVAHCRACGVRSVGLLCVSTADLAHLRELFSAAGIVAAPVPAAQRLDARWQSSCDVESRAYADTRRLLAGDDWPDLLYAPDDFASRGVYTALLAAGVRVPERIQVIGGANLGRAPVFPVQPTRVEADPVAVADAMADAVLDAIDQPQRPIADRYMSPCFRLVIGDTTRNPGV